MTNIRIFTGLWDHNGNEPVFKCDTGTFDENGVYTQFDGRSTPSDTTIDDFFQHLEENDGL